MSNVSVEDEVNILPVKPVVLGKESTRADSQQDQYTSPGQ
jgi:hypothetical protein